MPSCSRITPDIRARPDDDTNRRYFQVPPAPGQGILVMDLFIPGENAVPLKGDGRDFENPLRNPDLDKLGHYLAAHAQFRTDPLPVEHFSLIASFPTKAGSVYEDQADYPLH